MRKKMRKKMRSQNRKTIDAIYKGWKNILMRAELPTKSTDEARTQLPSLASLLSLQHYQPRAVRTMVGPSARLPSEYNHRAGPF